MAKATDKLKALDILNDSYIGEILDANDPDFKGRCKIRVYGVFGQKDESKNKIPVEDLPWAYPIYKNSFAGKGTGTGAFSTPRKGAIVRVIFDRDKYHPKYVGLEELDEKLKGELQNDYEGFHSLLYDMDEKIKIYYAKKTGILIYFDGGIINLKPDNTILLDHKGSTSTIELSDNNIDMVTNSTVNVSAPNQVTVNSAKIHENGDAVDIGANPIYSSVNGEQLMILAKILATAIDAKLNVTPGINVGVVNAMESLILSKTVKVSP